MAEVRAFGAMRFTKKSGDVAANVCPPYDIVSEKERDDYIAKSPNNIIQLELPKGENAYAEAKKTLDGFRRDGILANDVKKCFYIYEEEFTDNNVKRRIKGIFARVRLYDFSEKVVLPHEETLSKAKEDRFRLMCATNCNFSPIYSMYSDDGSIKKKLDELSCGTPEHEFAAKDGVIQRFWTVDDAESIKYIENAFEKKQLFIADGHHRYETGLRYRDHLLSNGEELGGAGSIMMFLVDMENDGLCVLPTHRLLRELADFDENAAVSSMRKYFDIENICSDCAEEALDKHKDVTSFVFVTKENAYALYAKENVKTAMEELLPEKSEAYRELDVSVLHTLILERIFGIDRENMARQINLTYTRDAYEAQDGVRGGRYQCAFLLNATKVSQIRDVAKANDKMPQKSTYFYPKIITGLVMNDLSEK